MSKRMPIISNISDALLPYMPGLGRKLSMAGDKRQPDEFLDGVLLTALAMAFFTTAVVTWLAVIYWISLALPVVVFVLVFISFFYYGYIYPELKIIRRKKTIISFFIKLSFLTRC